MKCVAAVAVCALVGTDATTVWGSTSKFPISLFNKGSNDKVDVPALDLGLKMKQTIHETDSGKLSAEAVFSTRNLKDDDSSLASLIDDLILKGNVEVSDEFDASLEAKLNVAKKAADIALSALVKSAERNFGKFTANFNTASKRASLGLDTDIEFDDKVLTLTPKYTVDTIDEIGDGVVELGMSSDFSKSTSGKILLKKPINGDIDGTVSFKHKLQNAQSIEPTFSFPSKKVGVEYTKKFDDGSDVKLGINSDKILSGTWKEGATRDGRWEATLEVPVEDWKNGKMGFRREFDF
uniref:Lipid/polyisoprenoid-binding YceI-like domain-containing protein n=1 Tax=Chromera velia CCMP2878 TaxID=1169474 RepID=A0A0G4IFX2_9ALVE|mmetsp:Transcript_20521/g.41017  ORF Transcript_20521/g.41017 Transcript_20521/m.41017 type:complete len:294 (+) Transcript_20521:92-973(+)|eukprot:Cvel_14104.t1-p1 / transcript=Cvel_14104.t1 / gene=Cvel_14104 / organism=Chromera_velia_CCMP2878 / gene_product=hypothetical protein / transcript_product=hypothetical protein / location=Cvel_scaffold992:40045-41650(-) / protein_length=293 / sequence_SO=supercontig / SO=protein_coding / is_pseudo=false